MLSRKLAAIGIVVVAGVVLASLWLGNRESGRSAPAAALTRTSDAKAEEPKDAPVAAKRLRDDERIVSDAERLDALARAQVWHAPAVPIGRARLGRIDSTPQAVTCRFRLGALGGTTAKFDCDVAGEKVRIKYGVGPELPAEAAATRLLRVLGFGADEVALVPRLRCHGCPAEPFVIAKIVEATHTKPLYEKAVDYGDYRDFDWVALERKFDARPIETEAVEGWSFHELEAIDPATGGAPRAHVDALRLMAVFLAHWDNKSQNQRLVCLSREWPDGTSCRAPFAMIQDLGGTFGPRKVDLEEWAQMEIFEDRARCVISMRQLPYGGATFAAVQIGEAGRRHLAGLLSQLTERQITDLFSAARFDHKRTMFTDVHPIDEWIRVFQAKVRAISDGPPCPS